MPDTQITEELIRTEIKRLIADVTEREPDEITDTASFADDLGVDSLMAMEVMVAVDKKFKIDIPEEEFGKIKNVLDAVAMVQKHLPGGRGSGRRMMRVAVTGIGAVTPIGTGRETFWRGLLEGKSGIGPVTSFDSSPFPVHIGGEVRDFVPEQHLRRLNPETTGRASQLAAAAARNGARGCRHRPCRTSTASASASPWGPRRASRLYVEQYNNIRKAEGEAAIPGDIFPRYPCHVIPTHVAIELDVHGPCMMIPTACAAGNYAIGYGFDLMRMGRADLMLAGGADAFSRITYMGFARLGAIAPEKCQPFDKNRKGMVPGEGAAILVLEPLEKAKRAGRKDLRRSAGLRRELRLAPHDGGPPARRRRDSRDGRRDARERQDHPRHRLHQRARHRHSDQ